MGMPQCDRLPQKGSPWNLRISYKGDQKPSVHRGMGDQDEGQASCTRNSKEKWMKSWVSHHRKKGTQEEPSWLYMSSQHSHYDIGSLASLGSLSCQLTLFCQPGLQHTAQPEPWSCPPSCYLLPTPWKQMLVCGLLSLWPELLTRAGQSGYLLSSPPFILSICGEH
jgi:hypothetical protein